MKLFSLAFNTIIFFSDKPLKKITVLGFLISFVSVLFGFYFFIEALSGEIKEPGFSSLIISIWLLSGIIISIVGIVGLYLGKTFN